MARKSLTNLFLLNMELLYNRYINYYSNLGMNRFRWYNLPQGMESRHIEKALFNKGQAIFFRNKEIEKGYDLLCLPCQPSNNLNVYGDPTEYNAIGVNQSFMCISADECVRIIDNDMLMPPLQHVSYYAYLMANTEMAINMNLDQQKFPLVIGATKKNELSLRNIYQKYTNFDPLLLVDEQLSNKLTGDGEGFKAINTSVPYVIDKLGDFKKTCEYELLTFLGINNSNTDKKERLLKDEVNANNDFINMSIDLAYKNRLLACEKINEMFGLNVRVELVSDILYKEGGFDVTE